MPEFSDTPQFPELSNNDGLKGDEPLSFQPDEDYRINLSVFEGPVDLLLYLIRKKELDIHEISLSEIVREYLDYVEIIKLIDIERAGDFIVVATTLMKIKSRSLFASQEEEMEGQDGDDPRQSLIRYLMEYEKFGEVAEKLGEKEEERRGIFPRGGEKSRISQFVDETETAPDFLLFDMLTALKEVMKSAPKKATHDVELLNITSESKQREILEELGRSEKIDFIELVTGQPKIIIVVTFVALLELIKNRKIQIRQSKQFSRITITLRTVRDDPEDADDGNKTEAE